MFSYYLHHLLLRNNMDNFRRMNISYRNNGRIIIHHSDSSKTNLNHFPTNSELIPSIIRDPTCMQTENRVFEILFSCEDNEIKDFRE